MALQVLGVKVGFIAVRAREFAICILGWNRGALRSAIDTVGDRGCTARNARQDTAATLGAHNLCARLFLSVRGAIGAVDIGTHTPGLAIRVAEGTGGHAIEIAAVAWGSGSDGLWVALRGRRGRQHACWGRRIGLRRVTL